MVDQPSLVMPDRAEGANPARAGGGKKCVSASAVAEKKVRAARARARGRVRHGRREGQKGRSRA